MGIYKATLMTIIGSMALTGAAWAQDDTAGNPRYAGETGPCPATAPHEVALALSARRTASCETIVQCMNLDKNVANVTVQFFFSIGNGQVGSDVSYPIDPGDSINFGTSTTDPLGIRFIQANAGAGTFQGKARICGATKKLACDTIISCSLANGPMVLPVTMIKKKQRGD
jgi:hypothetical protein